MSNENAIEKAAETIETAVAKCGIEAIANLPTFLKAARMAEGIRALRNALTDDFLNATLMPLQGNRLGFLTDRDVNKDGTRGNGYHVTVVRDVTIEAMLRGFSMVGNEVNIIGGNFYGTKAGWERKVREFKGLTDLVVQPGVPAIGEKGALVPFMISWKLGGKEHVMRCAQEKDGTDHRIPVRVNAGMGADAVLGKAERKAFFRAYRILHGSAYGASDGEVGDADAIPTTGEPVAPTVPTGTPEGRRIKLNGKAPSTPPPANETQAAANPEDDGR